MAKAPLSIGRFLLVFILWWTVSAFSHALLLISFGLGIGFAVIDSLVCNILVAGCCAFISNNMQYYLPKKERYWYILFISIVLSALILLSARGILVPLLNRSAGNTVYTEFFDRSWPVRFDVFFLELACMTILSLLWYSSLEETENIRRSHDTQRLAKEAELLKLRQQLAPHFLFNSLNSISALTGSQPEQARKMIQQLSDFLRGNLKKEEQQWVLLSEELQYLELYLDIEKVRFGHRLTTTIDYDEASLGMRLPPMLLQPIVENAIKFGLYDTMDAVNISILARTENNWVRIEVQNPFDPETSRPKKGAGFGLSSIQRRLYLLFARPDLLETRVESNLFTTIVKIPQ